MNKRIKELEKQCWTQRINGVLVDGQLQFDIQKFAQLIIAECLFSLKPNLYVSGIDYVVDQATYNKCERIIKQHFSDNE